MSWRSQKTSTQSIFTWIGGGTSVYIVQLFKRKITLSLTIFLPYASQVFSAPQVKQRNKNCIVPKQAKL